MGNEETAAPSHETSVGMFLCNVIVFLEYCGTLTCYRHGLTCKIIKTKKAMQPKVDICVSRMKLRSYTSHLNKKKTLQEQGVR